VTLLELYKKERNYGRSGSSIAVWNMVVMDARFAIFKVVLNSHIQDVPLEDLIPDCVVFFMDKEWQMIYNKDSRDGLKRGICFVNNFDYDHAPMEEESKPSAEEEDGNVTPDRHP
jgi:hypothetical protein